MLTMTLDEFKHLNESKGKFYFSPDTMSFFKSEVEYWTNSGFFITSEKGPAQTKKMFTIRRANFETGNVENISKFQEYKTFDAAKTVMMRY